METKRFMLIIGLLSVFLLIGMVSGAVSRDIDLGRLNPEVEIIFPEDELKDGDDLSSNFAGGSGTEEDPYQISTCEQLQNMNLDLDAFYELINDVDCSDTVNWNCYCENEIFFPFGFDYDPLNDCYSVSNSSGCECKGFDPIGGPLTLNPQNQLIGNYSFDGVLRGNNYEIKNLYINRPNQLGVGLISFTQEMNNHTVISDLNFVNYYIVGRGLVGVAMGYASDLVNIHVSSERDFVFSNNLIYNFSNLGESTCESGVNLFNYSVGLFVSGKEEGYYYNSIGGISGSAKNVEDSSFAGNINGYDYVGGVSGHTFGGIYNCSSRGNISGNEFVGGLTGSSWKVKDSYSDCFVNGTKRIGGLSGISHYISSSYSFSDVNGENYTGGLSGESFYTTSESYSNGKINGYDYVGGLIGYSSGSLINSYSEAEVLGKYHVGGLVGLFDFAQDYRSLNNSYFNGVVEGTYSVGGLFGKVGVKSKIFSSFSLGSVKGNDYVGGFGGQGLSNIFIVNSSWYNSVTNPSRCLGSGEDKGCKSVNNQSYFYNSSNAPMSSWDFENVWAEVQRGYPIFQSQVDNYQCINDSGCFGGRECHNFICVKPADIDEDEEQENTNYDILINSREGDNSEDDEETVSRFEKNELYEKASKKVINLNNELIPLESGSSSIKLVNKDKKMHLVNVLQKIKNLFIYS